MSTTYGIKRTLAEREGYSFSADKLNKFKCLQTASVHVMYQAYVTMSIGANRSKSGARKMWERTGVPILSRTPEDTEDA